MKPSQKYVKRLTELSNQELKKEVRLTHGEYIKLFCHYAYKNAKPMYEGVNFEELCELFIAKFELLEKEVESRGDY